MSVSSLSHGLIERQGYVASWPTFVTRFKSKISCFRFPSLSGYSRSLESLLGGNLDRVLNHMSQACIPDYVVRRGSFTMISFRNGFKKAAIVQWELRSPEADVQSRDSERSPVRIRLAALIFFKRVSAITLPPAASSILIGGFKRDWIPTKVSPLDRERLTGYATASEDNGLNEDRSSVVKYGYSCVCREG